MIKQLYSWEAFAAVALTLVSQTAYRFEAGVGIGEILLAIFIGVTFAQVLTQDHDNPIPPHLSYIKYFLWFLIVALIPTTIISSFGGLVGSSPRDIFAYLISILFIIAIIFKRLNLSRTGVYFAVFFVAICIVQYLVGGDSAWYDGRRFVGGAKNPNQLALYVMCLLVILPTLELRTLWKILIFGSLIIIGLMSRSDALELTFALVALVWGLMYLIPRTRFIVFLLIVSFPIFFISYYFVVETSILQQVTDIWSSADEGDTRVKLYINGLKAYGSIPIAWPFGLGAGGFSGDDGPFGGREAHNTFIDFLTIGGVVGVLLLYAPIVSSGWNAYCRKWHLLAALMFGLFVFSSFHFVARQPVFWFTLIVVSNALYKHRLNSEQENAPVPAVGTPSIAT